MEAGRNNLAFIVEDNEMFSTILNHTLSNGSVCDFISFKSGEECISNLYMNPKMIVMDYGLPGMSGLKTLKVIKKYNPDIPVVVITSTNDEKNKKDFLNEGVFAYLVKQKSTIQQIINIINKVLDKGNRNNIKIAGSDSSSRVFAGMMVAIFLIALSTMVTLYFMKG